MTSQNYVQQFVVMVTTKTRIAASKAVFVVWFYGHLIHRTIRRNETQREWNSYILLLPVLTDFRRTLVSGRHNYGGERVWSIGNLIVSLHFIDA